MCKTLVHKLGRKIPRTTKELLDIATTHASSEDKVGAILNHHMHKAKHDKEPDCGPEADPIRGRKTGGGTTKFW